MKIVSYSLQYINNMRVKMAEESRRRARLFKDCAAHKRLVSVLRNLLRELSEKPDIQFC